LWARGDPQRQPTLTQLTANPPDLPVTSARISPDGRYLAYADQTGIQVRVIDTGETQRIADTRDMEVQGGARLDRGRDTHSGRVVRHGHVHGLGPLTRRWHQAPLRGGMARDGCGDL